MSHNHIICIGDDVARHELERAAGVLRLLAVTSGMRQTRLLQRPTGSPMDNVPTHEHHS